MNTTQNYLTKLKAKHGGASDYKASSILGISQQAVSKYKNGQRQMNEEVAEKVAIELGLDPLKVYAEIQKEGAKSLGARRFWARILEQSKSVPALALLGFTAVLPMANEALSIF